MNPRLKSPISLVLCSRPEEKVLRGQDRVPRPSRQVREGEPSARPIPRLRHRGGHGHLGAHGEAGGVPGKAGRRRRRKVIRHYFTSKIYFDAFMIEQFPQIWHDVAAGSRLPRLEQELAVRGPQ